MTRARLESTTPDELARIFLEEVARANLAFAKQRGDFIAQLERTAGKGILDEATKAAASSAGLMIKEARATFWLEPVRLSWWQRLRIFFGAPKPQPWQLGPPERGVRYEVTVAPGDNNAPPLRAQLCECVPPAPASAPQLPAQGEST
jgi:hypothetical protein